MQVFYSLSISMFLLEIHLSRRWGSGPPREIMQGGTRLLWGPRDRLRFLSKLSIWGPIKQLVYFHICLISCALECPDNIYFIQSSGKHNQLMQQGVNCLSCFIVNKIWSTAIKIIYQICFYNPNRDLEKTFRNPQSDPQLGNMCM